MSRPRTYVREEVVRKATDLFLRKGYEGAHLQELVDVTGLNRFSLYKEFGGKEGLFQAALDAYLARLESLSGHLQRDPPGLANLRAFYTDLLAHDFPHGCLAVNTIREKHVVSRRTYATVERFVASSEQQLLRNLEAARVRGELAPDTDAAGLAKCLAALDMGLMTYGVVAPGRMDAAQFQAMLDRLLR
jgi:TetR/AcrR family transcriptional regulator, copper-responsive repressor